MVFPAPRNACLWLRGRLSRDHENRSIPSLNDPCYKLATQLQLMLYRCKTVDSTTQRARKALTKKSTFVFGEICFLNGKLAAVESRQLPANKTDELFQQKTLLRVLLFRVQTKQTPVHNNEPANDRKKYIYTQHLMNVGLPCDMSPCCVLQKVSLRGKKKSSGVG